MIPAIPSWNSQVEIVFITWQRFTKPFDRMWLLIGHSLTPDKNNFYSSQRTLTSRKRLTSSDTRKVELKKQKFREKVDLKKQKLTNPGSRDQLGH